MPKPNKPPAINATITLKHSNDWAKLGLRIELGEVKDKLAHLKMKS
jgi:hypothetical protein